RPTPLPPCSCAPRPNLLRRPQRRQTAPRRPAPRLSASGMSRLFPREPASFPTALSLIWASRSGTPTARRSSTLLALPPPAAASDFCLGVWEKTGPFSYKLNHLALSSDLNGNMVGPANIRENVTLGPQGTTYTGTFSIDQYDTSRHLLAAIVGEVKAPRITVDTKISDIL